MIMREIKRSDINEQNANSGIVEAGDFVFIGVCVGNIGQSIENQINGAIDLLESRLENNWPNIRICCKIGLLV
jgi:hypothetical protein